jgi:superfamily II DNA or RNA helicase
MSTNKRLFFQGGTLVLDGGMAEETMPAPFAWINGRWRCPAYVYGTLLPWLAQQHITDQVPRWQPLHIMLLDTRELYDYQQAALAAWEQAQRRGSVVLPTGAGKTLVAIYAILRVNRSAVVVCPTVDLLHQWYSRLRSAFACEVGVYYGGEKLLHPLMVTTYHSLGDLMAEYGTYYKLIIFDEVHHLPARAWGEAAFMAPAPCRLGLTATYPTEEEQREARGRWNLDELIGPLVFVQRMEELVGEQLAHYRTQRLRVSLTPQERQLYERDHALYMGFVRARQLPRRFGAGWLRELMRLSASDREARAALLARQRMLHLLAGCQGKLQTVESLLHEHSSDLCLIFTENNSVAYTLARRLLIPVISHETRAAERKDILDGFAERRYRAIITSRVLNEGVDVPEAKVAIILGGTAGAREYLQRLGRVLRKVENRQAVLYEILVRDTVEEGRAHRRRKAVKAQQQEVKRADG